MTIRARREVVVEYSTLVTDKQAEKLLAGVTFRESPESITIGGHEFTRRQYYTKLKGMEKRVPRWAKE